MKKISFTTLSGKSFNSVLFDENQFFDYMRHCGVFGIEKENQIMLFLNNIHAKLLENLPFDSVHFIEYDFSEEFYRRYAEINNLLKYDL
ncbi:hypothetical protein [uncultured Draconibacterium sp.]|uniref:hypothetical protein n=1 Tax=uncultured Draconibacterium sp. TaxID=1573823 RepID=UPI0025E37969|nr:hypothetical protein [uncultured Draconibacterium sp.]